MSDLKQYFEEKRQTMIDRLINLVNHESFSSDKAAVDACAAHIDEVFRSAGASVEIIPREDVGNIVFGKWNIDADAAPILILSHMDTVHPVGSLGERPAHLENDERLYGPGALDMKGGIIIALTAIEELKERGELPQRPIWYIVTSDEEIGSLRSRELIEDTARQAGLVMVTEPPTADGALKTWRKGVSSYKIEVTGRNAHAGNEPEAGVNAVIEFAQHALELHALNDYKNGTSVSVTRVEGGTATNVIPAQAVGYIDTRMMTVQAYQRLHETIMTRAPFIPGAEIKMTQLHYRPPMERHGDVFEQARKIAESNGMIIREAGAGGGSDGNFTAALGIPTLDGLGPEGSGLHAPHEHILVSTFPDKAAFFAAVLRDWDM